MQCAVLLTGTPVALSGRADFRSLYAAGYMVRSGDAHRIYDIDRETEVQSQLVPLRGVLPYLYPAFSALLFVPFSLLRWRIAYYAFFAVNFLLLWLSARLEPVS